MSGFDGKHQLGAQIGFPVPSPTPAPTENPIARWFKSLFGSGAQAERIHAAPMPSQSPENTWDTYGFSGKNKPKQR